MIEYHGHPFFHEQSVEETALHNAKNHDYSKGGDPLGNFQRVAAILKLYPGLDPSDPKVVALIYALKQWDAVLWGIAQKIDHKVEGLHGRAQDVSIYAKLMRCIMKDQESERIKEKETLRTSTWTAKIGDTVVRELPQPSSAGTAMGY